MPAKATICISVLNQESPPEDVGHGRMSRDVGYALSHMYFILGWAAIRVSSRKFDKYLHKTAEAKGSYSWLDTVHPKALDLHLCTRLNDKNPWITAKVEMAKVPVLSQPAQARLAGSVSSIPHVLTTYLLHRSTCKYPIRINQNQITFY